MLFAKFTRPKRIVVATAATAVAVAIALSGCAGTATPKSSASAGSTAVGDLLTVAATYGPTSLDPALQAVDSINNWYVNLAYDTLIRLDADGKLVPDLATSWKYTDSDNKLFELTIRKDVKFSDGTAVTADAIAKSLTYSITKGVNGPNWLAGITSVTAKDASTVLVTSSTSNDSIPFLLSQRLLLGSIINPTGLANPTSLKSASFGAGPYVLDTAATIANDSYVYTPNPNYWDKSKIHWKKVVIKVVGNTAAALQAVQAGSADLFAGDATTATAAKAAGFAVATAPFGLTGINIMDRDGTIVPALKEPKVRQALMYALDRKPIATAVYRDLATAGSSPVLKGYPGYSDKLNDAYPYDVAKAKALLKEAGYADGFSFNIAAPNAQSTNLMAQAVVQQWAAIGVKATLTAYADNGQMVTDILAKKYPVTAFIYGALPTYIESKSFFTGGATQYNAWNITDSAITSDLAEAASAKTIDAQEKSYASALNTSVVTNAWFANVYTRFSTMVYNQKKLGTIKLSSPNPTPDLAWDVVPAATK